MEGVFTSQTSKAEKRTDRDTYLVPKQTRNSQGEVYELETVHIRTLLALVDRHAHPTSIVSYHIVSGSEAWLPVNGTGSGAPREREEPTIFRRTMYVDVDRCISGTAASSTKDPSAGLAIGNDHWGRLRKLETRPVSCRKS